MAAPKKKAGKPAASAKVKPTEMSFGDKPLDKGDIQELLKAMRSGDDGAPDVMMASGEGLDVAIRGVISTQCAQLDEAIGRQGVPLGRLTILHGPEGCGKTTLALHLVSECQQMGGVAVYLDKEYKLDFDYAKKLGVDLDRLFLRQPDTLEQAFEFSAAAIRHAAALRERLGRRVPVLIVLDSMNAAITKAQLEGDWDSDHYAPQARVFSKNLPRLMPKVYKDDVALVWVSQVRKKMNVTFGNDEELAGGQSPRFYASLIIHIKRIGALKKDDEAFANITLAKVTKNQVAPPFKKAQFIIRYGYGIDNERSILELAVKASAVDKSGAWYSFEGERLGNGLDNSSAFLRDNPDVRERIWTAVKAIPATE